MTKNGTIRPIWTNTFHIGKNLSQYFLKMCSAQSSKLSQQVGNKIRFFRQKKDMTQEELAQKAGVERSYIGRIERGERLRTLDRLQAIAKGLSTPLWKLFK